MTEEEKDFAEKVVRLSYKCATELKVSTKDVTSDVFIKWLIGKIDIQEKGGENNNEVENIDISV